MKISEYIMPHIGIYLQNKSDFLSLADNIFSNLLLKDLVDLEGKRGEMFSKMTIDKFIDRELKHDHFVVRSDNNNPLHKMSSGQQRKSLLQYLISQKPDFLVLDDIFASVDKETRAHIIEQLSLIADETLFIQIFYRKTDILDFIHTVVIPDESGKVQSVVGKEDFIQKHQADNIRPQSFELPYCLSNLEPMANPLISLNNVSLSYGEKKVLNGISWIIRQGEFWQLTGPVGSGKSSLLSMIVGDNPKGYGQDITLFGRKKGSGESIWDIKKHIGYFTPSMLAQFKRNESVEHMIVSGMLDSVGLYVKPTDLQTQTARKWLNLLGDSYRDRKFMQLSYGQQRIVMVVRALVKQPPLLILDEPTTGLDDENAALFISMIRAIANTRRVAVIYVSHREEPGLNPQYVYTLIPDDTNGSKGVTQVPQTEK